MPPVMCTVCYYFLRNDYEDSELPHLKKEKRMKEKPLWTNYHSVMKTQFVARTFGQGFLEHIFEKVVFITVL